MTMAPIYGWSESKPNVVLLHLDLPTRRGGDFDKWDPEIQTGVFGSARTLMAVEEHGVGKQFARFRIWPRWSRKCFAIACLFGATAYHAFLDQAWVAGTTISGIGLTVAARMVSDCSASMGTLVNALKRLRNEESNVQP
jgi:hypothetical protein